MFLQSERLAYTVGQATILFYYAAIYTHVLIGLNRYIAIAKPFSYGVYFNDRKTMKWIALIWFISFVQSCIYQFGKFFFIFILQFHFENNNFWRNENVPLAWKAIKINTFWNYVQTIEYFIFQKVAIITSIVPQCCLFIPMRLALKLFLFIVNFT